MHQILKDQQQNIRRVPKAPGNLTQEKQTELAVMRV